MSFFHDPDYHESLPAILTPQEIAEEQRTDPNTVLCWIKRGVRANGRHVRLEAYKAGSMWRVRREDWIQFLRDCDPEPLRRIAEAQAAERGDRRRRVNAC